MVISLGCLLALAGDAQAAWYDPAWSFRKQITIDSSMTVNTNQSDFPVLIHQASDTDLAASAGADASDILFTAADGTTRLDHEIEKYASSTGELWAWVRIPTLSSSADTVLYMYYGNDAAADQQNATGVWTNDFVGVWHLAEDPSSSADGDCGGGSYEVCDSTANGLHGDSTGSMNNADQVTGKLNGAVEFDGSDDKIDFSDNAGFETAPITISAWARLNTAASVAGHDERIIQKKNGSDPWQVWNIWFESSDDKVHFHIVHSDSSATKVISDSATGASTWYHVVGTYDQSGPAGDRMRLYINGTKQSDSKGPTLDIYNGSSELTLSNSSSSTVFDGIIDEVRISGISRTADWIQTEFNNQNNPSGYLTFGEETIAAVITVTKLSTVISDPVAGVTNPKRIPGSIIEYHITPSNSGEGSPDADSTVVIDVIDTASVEYDATTGITFTDGETISGLTLDTVTYSDDPAPGPYTYDYTPVPDGDGYDGNVTGIRITTTGEFAYGGSPDPSFSIKYRVRTR